MSTTTVRALRFDPLSALLALTLGLAGCSKKTEPAPPQSTTQSTAAATPASAPAAPLKIAFAYVGPVGDAGWSFAHDAGRKAVAQKFGSKVSTPSA